MKQIQHPSSRQLSILLVPIVVAATLLLFVSEAYHVWLNVIMIAFGVAYFAALTYFCIKQKCHQQLIAAYLMLVIFVVTIWAIDHVGH